MVTKMNQGFRDHCPAQINCGQLIACNCWNFSAAVDFSFCTARKKEKYPKRQEAPCSGACTTMQSRWKISPISVSLIPSKSSRIQIIRMMNRICFLIFAFSLPPFFSSVCAACNCAGTCAAYRFFCFLSSSWILITASSCNVNFGNVVKFWLFSVISKNLIL